MEKRKSAGRNRVPQDLRTRTRTPCAGRRQFAAQAWRGQNWGQESKFRPLISKFGLRQIGRPYLDIQGTKRD